MNKFAKFESLWGAITAGQREIDELGERITQIKNERDAALYEYRAKLIPAVSIHREGETPERRYIRCQSCGRSCGIIADQELSACCGAGIEIR